MHDLSERPIERRWMAAVSLCVITACVCAYAASWADDEPPAKVEPRPAAVGQVRLQVMVNGVVVQGNAAVVNVQAKDVPEAGEKKQDKKEEKKGEEKEEVEGEEGDGESVIPGTTRAVFFDEDRDLGARLRKAEQLRDAGRLQEAFDLYLWVLESGGEVLFRLDEHRLTGVRDHCMRKIAELPADFLTQYRLRSDGEVGRLFEEARKKMDPAELESLGERHYLSSYGPEVLDWAGDVYAGRGESERAAACWRRMLKWGTGRIAPELIETKLVLVLSRAGKTREARAVLETMRERGATTRVTLAGAERAAVAYLDETLPKSADAPARKVAVNRGHWPQVGGESGHGETMPARFQCDVKVGEFVIEGYDWKAPPTNVQVAGYNPMQAQMLRGYAPFVPVYAGGRVFIHDEGGLMAFRLNAISEEWTVGALGAKTPDGRGRPVYFNPGAGARGWVCAYAGGVVYASLLKNGEAEVWAVSEQGKTIWRIHRSIVGYEWLSGVTSVSDPVVYEGSAFFLVWKGDAYRHDCTLVSVDASTGKLLWKEFICAGAQMPNYYYRGAMRPPVSVNVPAASDGVVVACSDLGGIAALDARSGEFRWGFAYEQYSGDYRNFFVPNRSTPPPLAAVSFSAPVIHEGVVYVTPKDSTGIYAVDLDTGRCLWQRPCGSGNSLLGVAGERVLVVGTSLAAYDVFSGDLAWKNDDLVATGHGFITEDAVYLPTTEAIRRYDPASGKLLGRLLVSDEEGEFGNLLLVEDTMVQVGRSAGFYGMWERVHAKLADDIARNPADHEPHVKLGAIYARKEDRPAAIRSYERAVELMTGLEESRYDKERTEVRNRLYDLYQTEINQARTDGRLDRAVTLARRIGAYATTDERQVEAVVTLIDIHEKRGDWTDVVRQYQSFLEHPPKIVYAFDGSSSMLPTLHARLKIRELIARHGRAVYVEFDDRAAQLYRRGGPEDLQQVTTVYPNSTSALRALKRLADVEATQGHYRKAARYLTEYLRSTNEDATDLVGVQWKLAGYHERNGSMSAAKRILRDLAERFGDVKVGEGVAARPLRTVVAERLAKPEYRQAVRDEPALFVVPVKQELNVPVGGMPMVVEGDTEMTLVLDRYGMLRSIDGGTGKAVWGTNVASSYLTALELRGERLMVCGGRSVRVLDRGTGNAEWTYTVGNPIERALNRQVVAASLVGAAFDDEHVAVNIGGGTNELVLLDANAGGKVVWHKKLTTSPVWAPVIWQDRVVVTTVNSVDAYDIATGEQVIHLKADRPRKRAEALDDGRLLVGGMTSLMCVDLTNGRTLWSCAYRLYYNNPTSNDGVVQVGNRVCYVSYTTDRQVFCLDVEGGQELWSVTIGGAQDRPFALRLAGDDVYVLVMTTRGRDRNVRVHQLGLVDGKQRWQSPALEPKEPDTTFLATARDWRVGRREIVLLVDLWEMKQVGRVLRNTVREPMLYALDRQTGNIVQELEIPGTAQPAAMIRPTNLFNAEDMLWVTYWDHMVGLRGAKQP